MKPSSNRSAEFDLGEGNNELTVITLAERRGGFLKDDYHPV
jgi:hypothetical protein